MWWRAAKLQRTEADQKNNQQAVVAFQFLSVLFFLKKTLTLIVLIFLKKTGRFSSTVIVALIEKKSC